jgi:DNA repair protein RadC
MTPTAPATPQGDLSPRSTRRAPSVKLQPAQHAYAIPRYRVMLVKESLAHPSPVKIMDSQNAYRLLVPVFDGLDREHFMVVALDAKHAVIGINTVSIGSLTLSIVHPREVFKPLILMNASAVILAHNHPSGDPTPSPEDRALTRRLKEGGELLGITVLDHVVLGEDRYYSFADHGAL